MSLALAKPETRNTGLTTIEAEARLAEFGPNKLPEPKSSTLLELFGRQFLSPFIYILIGAAIVALAVGQIPSAIFITAVLFINAGIGTYQEYAAQQSSAALRKLVPSLATVVRDGKSQRLPVETIVPGDLVMLASGDKVPADIALGEAQGLSVDESMLTGESIAVEKTIKAIGGDDHALETNTIADRNGEVFAGSVILRGRGVGLVRAIGLGTAIGQIAESLSEEKIAEPPLVRRIRHFTHTVAAAIGVSILALFAIMALRGGYTQLEMLLMAVGLAVSAIPEGLPAALTVALAVGMNRMAQRNVIIRRLVAVEALGSCTFICSDKTGTLTVNELTIRRIVLPDGSESEVEGQGLSPIGSVHGAGSRALIERLCLAGVLANEAHLDYRDDRWVAEGDTVDAAFLILARKLGGDENAWRKTHHETDRVPYESERAWAASRNSLPGGGEEVFLKGSLETILPKCALMATPSGPHAIDPQRLEGQALALARRGYRTLALAAGPADSASGIADEPRGLTFLGLVGMIDPLRPEAAEAVARCREARIEVAMITGDHPETARTIALQLGLIRDDEPVVTGAEIGAADRTEALDPLVKQTRVFARIAPEQKRQIVESLIRSGEYVAVTGDGVNDAPALRHANVGIAMGDRGTDLARETADLILTDDNFASIVSGVEEGRIVYNNIRKVVALLVSTGASAILLFFLSVLAGLPMPLTAVQLLWLNLVANGVQDVALAFERAEGHELARPPRATTEPIFDSQMIAHVVLNGIWMGAIAFAVSFYHNTSGMDEDSTRNIVLMLMILFGNVHALNTRSEQRSLFKTSLTSNRLLLASIIFAQSAHLMAMHLPGLSHVLAIEPVRIGTWLELLVLAASLILLDEGLKAWHRRQIAAH